MEEIQTNRPAVARVSVKKDPSSDDVTYVEEQELMSDVEENSLVAEYLKNVTPGIAREFQV